MRFVKMKEVQEVLEIGFRTSTNVLLHGPAGHGKSEFVEFFFAELHGLQYGLGGEVFVKSLNGDTDEAALFGGINFRRLNDSDNPRLEYDLGRSFLTYKYTVFEEIFDAPPSVLCALKDTLTAGFYRGGEQFEVLNTKMVVGITNKSPQEIAELGPSERALTERFPLRWEVKWDRYGPKDYEEMFKSLEVVHSHTSTVARLAALATEEGFLVSPRTAVHANRLCRKDFAALQYLEGFVHVFEDVQRVIEEKAALDAFCAASGELADRFAGMSECSAVACLRKARRALEAAELISGLVDTDNIHQEREALTSHYLQEATRLQERAMEVVYE